MRLLLDEHLSPRLAALLRERGHDAVAVAERDELRSAPDADLWAVARADGRVVVTCNHADFLRLAATSDEHAGLVLVAGRDALGTQAIGGLAARLDRLAAEVAAPGSVVWLC